MPLNRIDAQDTGFINDAALFACGVLDIHALVAKHGGDAMTVTQMLAEPVRAQAIEARVITMGMSGELARAESHVLLRKATAHLLKALERPDIGPTTVIRIAEFASRVTGMTGNQERDLTFDDRPKFTLNINLDNQGTNKNLQSVDVIATEVRQ